MKIFKYKLDAGIQPVMVPRGAKPLHVGLDPAGEVCIWLLVDPSEPERELAVQLVGTGHEFTPIGPHIGSVTEGPFVWHVFADAEVES